MTRFLTVLVLVCGTTALPLAGCGDESSAEDDGATDDGGVDEGGADAEADSDDAPDVPDAEADADPCDELFAAAQALLDAEYADAPVAIPGIVLGLDVPHCGTWRGAVGNSVLSPLTPMTTDRITHVASMSKTFVAAVILQLAAEGALSLEDTLDAWRSDIPNAATITIRQLLGHRAGVRDFASDAGCVSRRSMPNTPDDLLACIHGDPADFAPGTSWRYSNTGYVLLGLIVEAVTGTDLHSVIRARMIEPLGLAHTSFLDEPVPAEYAHSYSGTRDITGSMDPSFPWACGDMRSDASDLLVWIRALVAGDVLDAASRAEMQDFMPTALPGVPTSYGLGLMTWELQDSAGTAVFTAVGHGGVGESVAIAWYIPDVDAAASILINHEGDGAHGAFAVEATSRILVNLGDRLRSFYP